MSSALAAFAQGIAGEQRGGTLKPLLATPTSPHLLLLLSSGYPLVRASTDAGIYLAGGLLFGLSFDLVNLPASFVLFVTAVLAFSAVGMLSATFALVLKRGDPVVWLFGALSWVFGGVFFPTDALPS